MWTNLKRARPPEKYWQPRSWRPSYRTTPRRGRCRCSRGQMSFDQDTLVDHPLGWCSGTPLDKVWWHQLNFVTCQRWRVRRDPWRWPSWQGRQPHRRDKMLAPKEFGALWRCLKSNQHSPRMYHHWHWNQGFLPADSRNPRVSTEYKQLSCNSLSVPGMWGESDLEHHTVVPEASIVRPRISPWRVL